LKNVFICWYGETTLEILKEKFIKSIKIRTHLNIRHRNFDKHKEFISKGLLKIRFNFDPSKDHNYHLVKVFLFIKIHT
jgi:hypothetical protein